MVAVALIHGDLKAEYYEDKFAADPRIDALRNKMVVVEEVCKIIAVGRPRCPGVCCCFNDGRALCMCLCLSCVCF